MIALYIVRVVKNKRKSAKSEESEKVWNMKKIWSRIRDRWRLFWRDDEYDLSVKHLSQSDKRDLWYGAFMVCMSAVALCSFVIAFSNIRVRRQNSEYMEELMGMIATYMGSATKDEYEEIAKTIRHDLVFSEYGQEIENYIRYIPNTSDSCRTCGEGFPSQAYLVCTNTGELYELDLFEKGANPDTGEYGYTSMSFGYDEVSQTNLHITKTPGNKEGTVTVQRGRGIVSVQRMKSLFCDDCIREILETVENQLVEEFVIFDAGEQKFYAVDDGSVQIGDYELQVEYDGGDYEIEVRYAK